MPTTLVHRLELMRLLYRFKGLVEWELEKLAALDTRTISLELEPPAFAVRKPERKPPPIATGTEPAAEAPAVSETPSIPGADAPDGSVAGSSGLTGGAAKAKHWSQDPTNLESCCRSADLPTGDYVELVDAATPYVRALAEE
ncbi:MAG: hypothetical protein RBU36_12825 [Thermoanaerobaculia bacterium]|jgi:hypothetical protein|nr:hypothetical protein [Thermoanaerobaculia bacterium]